MGVRGDLGIGIFIVAMNAFSINPLRAPHGTCLWRVTIRESSNQFLFLGEDTIHLSGVVACLARSGHGSRSSRKTRNDVVVVG